MTRTKVLAGAVIGLLGRMPPAAAQADGGCASRGTAVYFGNGIATAYDRAQEIADDDLPALASEANVSDVVELGVAYNHTDKLLLDVSQTLEEKQAEDARFRWFLLNNVTASLLQGLNVPGTLDLPPGGPALVATLQGIINHGIVDSNSQPSTFYDLDVADQVSAYEQDLANGYRIVLVAHSQGNLYAKAAHAALVARDGNLIGSFGIVGVANPTAITFNGYVTSDDDVIINSLRNLGRTVRPANVHVPMSGRDFRGHGFEEVYINAELPARAKVVALFSSIAVTLRYPAGATAGGCSDDGADGGTDGGSSLPAPPPLAAVAIGDSHLRTFDGVRYDCQPAGEEILVTAYYGDLDIQARTQPLATRNVAVTTAVAARIAGDSVAFYVDGTLTLDGAAASVDAGGTLLSGGGRIWALPGGGYALVWPDNSQLRVALVGQSIRTAVYLPTTRRGLVSGLLGNANGDPDDDLTTPDGMVKLTSPAAFADFYRMYVDSWRISQASSLFDYLPGQTTETLTDRTFPHRLETAQKLDAGSAQMGTAICQAAGVAADWMDACVLDVALSNGDARFASALSDAPPVSVSFVIMAPYGGPPEVTATLPQIVVPGDVITISGSNLAAVSGSTADVTVSLAATGEAGPPVAVVLPIVSASTTQLRVSAPADLFQQIPGTVTVTVATPEGAAVSGPLTIARSNGFGGGGTGTQGLFAAMYQLQPNTAQLPSFGGIDSLTDPCGDPTVINSPSTGSPCPLTTFNTPDLNLPDQGFSSGFPGFPQLTTWFAIRFRAVLDVQVAGTYQFETLSDDGSNVYLAGVEPSAGADAGAPALTQVVSNDGEHGFSGSLGPAVMLAAGKYEIVVDYFQGPRDNIGLQLLWIPPGGVLSSIPSSQLQILVP